MLRRHLAHAFARAPVLELSPCAALRVRWAATLVPAAEALGITQVLDVLEQLYQLHGTVRGREFSIICPDPKHNERKPSCDVNLDTGFWHCFSCGVGGDIAALGEKVWGVSREEVLDRIQPSSEERIRAKLKHRLSSIVQRRRPVLAVPLPDHFEDGPLTELKRRGFTTATLQRWGVQYVSELELIGNNGPFTISDAYAIPVRDEKGMLLSWVYRRTKISPEWMPKYLNHPGIPLDDIWFGLQHHAQARHVTVVEGALDTMWLDQWGHPAWGTIGSDMGTHKFNMLQRCESVTVMGDRDGGGVHLVTRIGEAVGDRVPLQVARYAPYEEAEDPQERHPVDLEVALARAVPWVRWRRQNRTA